MESVLGISWHLKLSHFLWILLFLCPLVHLQTGKLPLSSFPCLNPVLRLSEHNENQNFVKKTHKNTQEMVKSPSKQSTSLPGQTVSKFIPSGHLWW